MEATLWELQRAVHARRGVQRARPHLDRVRGRDAARAYGAAVLGDVRGELLPPGLGRVTHSAATSVTRGVRAVLRTKIPPTLFGAAPVYYGWPFAPGVDGPHGHTAQLAR